MVTMGDFVRGKWGQFKGATRSSRTPTSFWEMGGGGCVCGEGSMCGGDKFFLVIMACVILRVTGIDIFRNSSHRILCRILT